MAAERVSAAPKYGFYSADRISPNRKILFTCMAQDWTLQMVVQLKYLTLEGAPC